MELTWRPCDDIEARATSEVTNRIGFSQPCPNFRPRGSPLGETLSVTTSTPEGGVMGEI